MRIRPRVSVVIPAFNAAAYIADALESVLRQSYEPIECIVVDDGSTDATRRIVEGFGSRVTCLSTERRGVAAARNLGVSEARGEFVAFLDADDAWVSHKTACQIEALTESKGVGFAYSAMFRTDADLRVIGCMSAPSVTVAVRNTLLLQQPTIFLCQTGVVDRDAFLDIGGFDESLSVAADYDLIWRLSAHSEMKMVSAPLAFYRMSPHQMHLDTQTMKSDVDRSLHKGLEEGLLDAPLVRKARASLSFTLGVDAWSKGDSGSALREFYSCAAYLPRFSYHLMSRALGRRFMGSPSCS